MVSGSLFSTSKAAVLSKKREVGLADTFFQQDGVEDDRVPLPVAEEVLIHDLGDHAAFARPAVVVSHVRGGAQHPEAHFAGGIATGHGTVLDEDDLEPLAGGGDGGTGAGQAAADDDEVGVVGDGFQFAAVGGCFDDHGELEWELDFNRQSMAAPIPARTRAKIRITRRLPGLMGRRQAMAAPSATMLQATMRPGE